MDDAVGRSAKKEDISDVEGRENQISKAPEKAQGDPEPKRQGGCGGEKDICCVAGERRCRPPCGKVVGLVVGNVSFAPGDLYYSMKNKLRSSAVSKGEGGGLRKDSRGKLCSQSGTGNLESHGGIAG